MYVIKYEKNKHKKHYLLILLLLIFLLVLVCFIYGCYYIVSNAPYFDRNNLHLKQATILLDNKGNEIIRLGNENRELIKYSELPQSLIDAIVATEDSRFFQHNGFDIVRFSKATYLHLSGDKGAGGASTLTMQISKNLFTSNESEGIEGIIRKFTDIYLSMFKIEANLSKEEIFEIYVNSNYLGSNAYGVEMASWIYFGKSVKDLTLAESALIAGLFNAPSDYDPYIHPYEATKRRNEVLNLMYKHGYIDYDQLIDGYSINVSSLLIKRDNNSNPYQGFIDTVVNEVIEDTGLNPYQVPMIINTTMDRTINDAINTVMNNKNNFKDDVIQAGLAVTSTLDGSIMGIGNGRNRTGALQYNYATMIKRQPGSSIKPFMDYGPYFEFGGGTPDDIIVDEPFSYTNGIAIKNAYNDYVGPITIKTALADSRNIPALKIFLSLDRNKISDYVHGFNIDYGKNLYESASIGAFEGVSPLIMSAAYGAYARGGIYIKPYSYKSIIYRDNNELLEKNIEKRKVCSEQTAIYINDILSYAVKTSKIFGTLEVGKTEVAGKTGTTTISKTTIENLGLNEYAVMDSWGCMYSSKYSVGLWYGYDKVTKKNHMVPVDASLGRRRILKKLAKIIYTDDSKLITSLIEKK